MILPIIYYGSSLLRQCCENVDTNFPDLKQLIKDMWDTMEYAGGAGLAAPQVGRLIRVFVVETISSYKALRPKQREQYFKGDKGIREVFINPVITSRSASTTVDEEGCLSIPGLTGKVQRPDNINIRYIDENFQLQTAIYSGFTARIIQHEYDHIEGRLYIDRLSSSERKKIESVLRKI